MLNWYFVAYFEQKTYLKDMGERLMSSEKGGLWAYFKG